MTCPHCAIFHAKVIVSLKNDNSLKDIVKFEHHSFPLEIKALNAEKILHCIDNKEKRFELLTNLYKEQRNWASGSNIGDINKALKKIGEKSGLKEEDMNSCLKDDNKFPLGKSYLENHLHHDGAEDKMTSGRLA